MNVDTTSWKRSLTLHKQSLHEGKKYSCSSCDYQAIQKSHLKPHQQAVHEGKNYPCGSCDYQATHRGNLISNQSMKEINILVALVTIKPEN